MRHRLYSQIRKRPKKRRLLVCGLVAGGLLLCVFAFFLVRGLQNRPVPAIQETPEAALPPQQAGVLPEETAPARLPTATTPAQPAATPAPAAAPVRERDLYEVAVSLNADARMLYCTMRLTMANRAAEDLYELYFRLYPNYNQRDAFFDDPASYYQLAQEAGGVNVGAISINDRLVSHKLTGNGMLLQVPLAQELSPGEELTLVMNFTLRVPKQADRFGLTDMGYQLGNFLPVLAVYEDGHWDTRDTTAWGDPFYSETADYKVALSYPKEFGSVACSGVIASKTEPDNSGRATTYAAISNARGFACVLGRKLTLFRLEPEDGGPEILSWALTMNKAKRAAEYAKKAVEIFSEMLGPYPYPAFTVVQTEINGSGMEYPGLIMIDKGLYLSGLAESLELTIAHEAVHQWFYGLVGSDEIGAPWIDESLASYLGLVYFERAYDTEKFEKLLLRNTSGDASPKYPIDGSLSDYPGSSDYVGAVYLRGGAMMHALRQKIGDEAYFAGLWAYCRDNAFAIADRQTLISAFEAASDMPLANWFDGQLKSMEEE